MTIRALPQFGLTASLRKLFSGSTRLLKYRDILDELETMGLERGKTERALGGALLELVKRGELARSGDRDAYLYVAGAELRRV